jgi:hypothetical protein
VKSAFLLTELPLREIRPTRKLVPSIFGVFGSIPCEVREALQAGSVPQPLEHRYLALETAPKN